MKTIMTIRINISEEFSQTPGARHITDGDFSGEEFFNTILEPAYLKLAEGEILEINLDGTDGFATSFLDEAFGGLARKYGKHQILKSIRFISDEEPYLIEELISYMNE